MSEIQVRQATLKDLNAIYELESSIGKYPYPLVVLRQHFDLGSVLLVAEDGDKIVSYILGAFNPQTSIAHFVAVMTHPDYRQRGIARQLGEKLYSILLKFNPIEFQGVVSPDNTASLAACNSFGFLEHHIEENYYGGGERRVVLRKKVK